MKRTIAVFLSYFTIFLAVTTIQAANNNVGPVSAADIVNTLIVASRKGIADAQWALADAMILGKYTFQGRILSKKRQVKGRKLSAKTKTSRSNPIVYEEDILELLGEAVKSNHDLASSLLHFYEMNGILILDSGSENYLQSRFADAYFKIGQNIVNEWIYPCATKSAYAYLAAASLGHVEAQNQLANFVLSLRSKKTPVGKIFESLLVLNDLSERSIPVQQLLFGLDLESLTVVSGTCSEQWEKVKHGAYNMLLRETGGAGHGHLAGYLLKSLTRRYGIPCRGFNPDMEKNISRVVGVIMNLLKSVVKIDGQDSDALTSLGLAMLLGWEDNSNSTLCAKPKEKGFELLQSAMVINPGNARAVNNMALCLLFGLHNLDDSAGKPNRQLMQHALSMFQNAASLGNLEAIHNLRVFQDIFKQDPALESLRFESFLASWYPLLDDYALSQSCNFKTENEILQSLTTSNPQEAINPNNDNHFDLDIFVNDLFPFQA